MILFFNTQGTANRYKPDFVLQRRSGDHLSMRPEPGVYSAEELRLTPYLVLLQEEFTLTARLSPTPGGLLSHHFTLTFQGRRYNFCCTGLPTAYGPLYPSFQKDSLLLAVRTFLNM